MLHSHFKTCNYNRIRISLTCQILINKILLTKNTKEIWTSPSFSKLAYFCKILQIAVSAMLSKVPAVVKFSKKSGIADRCLMKFVLEEVLISALVFKLVKNWTKEKMLKGRLNKWSKLLVQALDLIHLSNRQSMLLKLTIRLRASMNRLKVNLS